MYYDVFGKDGAEISLYNKAELDRIAAILNVWFRVEYLRKKEISENFPPRSNERGTNKYLSNLARYHITWSYFFLIKYHHSDSLEKIIQAIADGKVLRNDNFNFIDNWYSDITLLIEQVLNEVDPIWRNWQRNSEQSTEKLKSKFSTTPYRVFPINDELL